MKLVIAIVQGEDADKTVQALAADGMPVTKVQSSGGFLQQGNATLFVGVEKEKVERVIELIKENSRERSQYMTPIPPMVEPGEFVMPYPVEVQVGGATVFVVDVDRFEKL